MAVRWESLRGGVVLVVVVAAFGWATLWPVVWKVGAQDAAPQEEAKRLLTRDKPGERRVALVIGNGAYRAARPLANPGNDARAMAGALRELGFEVLGAGGGGYVDLTRVEMVEAVKRFRQRLRESGGVGLFYFAGHGVEVGGVNYLIPVEADPREELDVKYQGVDVGDVLEAMKESRLGIVILDACRDNPFRGAWAGERTNGGWGLGRMEAPSGMLIAYATGPGKTARDGYQGGRNGLYTEVLLEVIRRSGMKVEEVFKGVRVEVERRSGGEQVPWEMSSLKGDFYFRSVGGGEIPVETPVGLEVEREVPRGTVVVRVGEIGMAVEVDGKALGVAEAKGEVFRVKGVAAGRMVTVVGRKAGMAAVEKRVEVEAGKEVAVELGFPGVGGGSAGTGVGSGVVSPGAQPPAGARAGQVWASPGGIRLVWIPAGEYEMGSNNGWEDEKPVHRVRVTQGFWLGETEVTQRQWAAVMGGNPSEFKDCPECPVEEVSWEDCRRFVSELNVRYPVGGGLVWRLPYEAEWEYACRGGTRSDYFGGDGEGVLGALGWYYGNSGGRTHPVRQKQPNGWGLYDMHGNVWEWCEDWYGADYYRISPVEDPRGPGSGSQRVLRGGAWTATPTAAAPPTAASARRRAGPRPRFARGGRRAVNPVWFPLRLFP